MELTAGKNTIEEILSEPATWLKCLNALDGSGKLHLLEEVLQKKVEYVFIGCGSSYYLAQSAAAMWSIVTGGEARAIPASEIVLFPQLLPQPCQPVLISRSGHTSEILAAAKQIEEQMGIGTLAVTCGSNTPLEQICKHAITLLAADEKSTVMTRSFTSMLIFLQALAAVRGGDRALASGLREIPAKTQALLPTMNAVVQSVAKGKTFADCVFLGQGPFFGVAQESMLKVKEMSCSYAQCFHTLEFRHGPKAIVSPETLVTFFLSESGYDAEVPVLTEMKELGGATFVVTNVANAAVRHSADYLIELGLDVPEVARVAASVIPGQLLGFHNGIKKGFNPDEPRNLTRVVMLDGASDGGLTGAST
jgi:glutamine---fructose-6-phosphate transaminase (isomerizing)